MERHFQSVRYGTQSLFLPAAFTLAQRALAAAAILARPAALIFDFFLATGGVDLVLAQRAF